MICKIVAALFCLALLWAGLDLGLSCHRAIKRWEEEES